jgi:hypothetical protein
VRHRGQQGAGWCGLPPFRLRTRSQSLRVSQQLPPPAPRLEAGSHREAVLSSERMQEKVGCWLAVRCRRRIRGAGGGGRPERGRSLSTAPRPPLPPGLTSFSKEHSVHGGQALEGARHGGAQRTQQHAAPRKESAAAGEGREVAGRAAAAGGAYHGRPLRRALSLHITQAPRQHSCADPQLGSRRPFPRQNRQTHATLKPSLPTRPPHTHAPQLLLLAEVRGGGRRQLRVEQGQGLVGGAAQPGVRGGQATQARCRARVGGLCVCGGGGGGALRGQWRAEGRG